MFKSRFVVVEHHAIRARLHWDLRFQLKNSKNWDSFAIRKGIPLETGKKVLAVKTRIHSEKEALFFGVIQKGYGAGKLIKWDDGQCIIHKYKPSHIIIEFKGRKLKGIYHMISTGVMNKRDYKKRSYMLFKSKKTVVESETLDELSPMKRAVVGMALGVPMMGHGRRITPRKCKELYPNNPGRYQACLQSMKPTESLRHQIDEVMGLISLVPRCGIVDDVEDSQDELNSEKLSWSKEFYNVGKPEIHKKLPWSKKIHKI